MSNDMELRKLLLKLGISSNMQGYFGILIAVNLIQKQKMHVSMGTIYKTISKELNKSEHQAERTIRYAVDRAYKLGTLQNIYPKVPDNSVFLYDLVFNFDIIKEVLENGK